MGKYILKRLLRGAFSAICVVLIVMILVYSLLDRSVILAADPNYSKMQSNARISYEQSRYEAYGYVDYVPYADYITELVKSGEITQEERAAIAKIGNTPLKDSEEAAEYIQKFTEKYTAEGYEIVRLDADARKNGQVKDGGQPALYAVRDVPLIKRALEYFTGMLFIDNIHYVPEETDIGERGLTFTLYDPVYNPTGTEKKFSPAIIGNGTMHKYLLYFDDRFPFIHQNFLTLHLGESYTVNRGVDVFTTMNASQGSYVLTEMIYPDTGFVEESADDLHTATYAAGSRELNAVYAERFDDDYTNVITHKTGKSKLGFSFVIGIIEVCIAYVLGISIGETDTNAAAGDEITVQIKDIGKWIAGEALAAGDELATDAAGKAVKASAGDFVVGTALSAASAAGSLVKVQISKTGYKPAAAASMGLNDLSDVDVSGKGDGKVLKYNGTSSKWEAAADATE